MAIQVIHTEEKKMTNGLDGITNKQSDGSTGEVRSLGLFNDKGASKVAPTVSSAAHISIVFLKSI